MMEEKNQSILDLIEKYKVQVKENNLKGEIYKWQLLFQYKGRPDINNENFYDDLLGINYSNLIYYNAGGVMKHLAKERPIEYQKCLTNLFNESTPLQDRINHFDFEMNNLYREIVPEEKFAHHHDERTISVLLTFKYPEKYTFFKDSYYKKYCKLLGRPTKSRGEKYVHYLELINDLINNYIIHDLELLDLIKPLLSPDCFSDENYTILAQDILYTQLDKGFEEINIGNNSIYKISMGEFTDNDFENCLKEKKVLVYKDTKGKGLSNETQGDIFEKINIGDYFYLTHGNGYDKIKLVGRITGDAIVATIDNFGKNNWLERSYEIIAKSINKNQYKNKNKWWTPNNNSTCIEIKKDDFELANNVLFEPYFNIHLISNSETENIEVLFENKNNTNTISNMNFPLNQILFGPPGTGKTYNTINKALEIIENKCEDTLKKESRIDLKNRFDNYAQNGQIVFTTFHQSMSYEDFIEGIKPKTIDETVTYSIEDGVFKKLCNKAKGKNIKSNNFEDAYSKLIKMIDEAPEKKIVLETLVHSKEFTIYKNSKNNIRFHANTEKAYEGVIKKEVIEQFLKTGEATDWPSYTKSLGSFIIENCNYSQQEVSEKQNFVLIIDEINRGNVSQIFGELITLIEDDKRMGANEALEVTLPYSKEKFSVPSNLYIIGTMNTADRSVEALDSALRRRFSFLEITPSPELLSQNTKFNHNDISLQDILVTINKRIEKLLDKDHKIGHSYFMNVSSMNELKTAFQNKIIPLLQEYFFGDYSKIGLVLGNGFIEKVELKKEKLFAEFDNDYESDYVEKPIYHLKNINKMNDGEFKEAIKLLLNKINLSS
jgi:5-methylcytosine-specific restriction protein B